jgi:hypothetical protein
MVEVERTRVSQVTPESPGIPRAMVLTVSSVLSPATGLFCHRRPRKLPFANLTPASGRQDHTSSPSASAPFVKSAARVHRIPPRVRDDRDTPLEWDETANHIFLIWGSEKQKYFCKGGWKFLQLGLDRHATDLPVGHVTRIVIASQRVARMRAR